MTLLDPDLDHRPLLFLDGRGLDAGTDPTLTAYEPWLAGTLAAAPAQVAESTRTAFVFYDADDQPPRRLSHGQLLEGARKLLARERLGPLARALLDPSAAAGCAGREALVKTTRGVAVASIDTGNLASGYATNVVRRKDLVLMRKPHQYRSLIKPSAL